MQLSQFRNLIAVMPVDYQASTSKRSTWEKHILERKRANEALLFVLDTFRTSDKVTLSRKDLRGLAKEQDLAHFVMATIVWGYTSGGRGNNVRNLIEQFNPLTRLLAEVRDQRIAEWNNHYEKVKRIKGLGLSTYTKFLNFLNVRVHGHAALILDRRIIQVATQNTFPEFTSLELSNSNNVDRYPSYLEQKPQCPI